MKETYKAGIGLLILSVISAIAFNFLAEPVLYPVSIVLFIIGAVVTVIGGFKSQRDKLKPQQPKVQAKV